MLTKKPVYESLYKPAYMLGLPPAFVFCLTIFCVAMGFLLKLLILFIIILVSVIGYLAIRFTNDRDWIIAEKILDKCPSCSKKIREEVYLPEPEEK